MMTAFRDRLEAGERLAPRLAHLRDQRPVVLALPRGGIPVGARIAEALGAPLEVFVSRKLGVPYQPELGFGAISEGGALWIDPRSESALGLDPETIEAVARKEALEVQRRVQVYRGGRPLPDLRDRAAILVDDGVATGGTLRAAIRGVRKLSPGRLIAAVPLAAADTAADLREEVDEWICLEEPELLWAIGAWYESFAQLSDEEVLAWLDCAHAGAAPPPS